ncbi:MAG TPA: aminoacetone oxidase family FAD-binding enzyme [Candidatus Eisenbacteria bacterium]|nr:aminoacetone oxidase family FAD-binding enzyme [Candidatus Eisenbacteria bacterium]
MPPGTEQGEARHPIVVIGAGAAGLMAALFAASGGRRRVVLLESTKDGGRKILMSGGGRCNVLPSELDPARFVTESSPNTMRKLLLAWPLAEQRRFFEEELALPLKLEEETGKLFPVSNKARDVRDGLVAAARRRGAEVRFNARVVALAPDLSRGGWTVGVEGAEEVRAARVIVATGGLSVPATGSDGRGLSIARGLGHTIHETYPALTPLTATPHRYAALSGISMPVTLDAADGKRRLTTRGGFLFTHKGYSGPSVLNLSHVCVRARIRGGPLPRVTAQWTPRDAEAWEAALRSREGTVTSALRGHVPARLAEALLESADVPSETPLAQLRREDRLRLVEALARHALPWSGDEGYTKAEVTGGGVALSEIDPRTLESKIHPGLYLCGEILDAFGPIGGYNFCWAWSTGRAAGLAAAASVDGLK